MVCASSALIVARRQCQPVLANPAVRYFAINNGGTGAGTGTGGTPTNGDGSGSGSGSGINDSENGSSNNSGSGGGGFINRQRISFLNTAALTGKHLTTRWNIWRASSTANGHNTHCTECGKPLRNIPSATRWFLYMGIF